MIFIVSALICAITIGGVIGYGRSRKVNLQIQEEQKKKLTEEETILRNRIAGLTSSLNDAELDYNNRIVELETNFQARKTEIQKTEISLQQNIVVLTNSLTDKQNERKKLETDILTLQSDVSSLLAQKQSIAADISGLNLSISAVKADLGHLQNQHSIATKRLTAENEGRTMEYIERDVRLTNTLEELKIVYPELADAFATIEGTKIWQSKFQAMTADLLKQDKCGIYRIWTIGENGTRSYIGQAKKIRERGSQHIKKMLGVDKPDNSLLYNNVTPSNAHFEVVEECAENLLTTKEKYGIEYYNCVTDGYNMKL